MEHRILAMLKDENEITWQSLLYNIVKQENMNPWDINVSKLARLYMRELRKLKELDLKLSGKVILAAAILLKIKSTRLVGEEIQELDRMFSSIQEAEIEEINDFDEFYQGLSLAMNNNETIIQNIPKLMPKTPQPRKRKVSIYDLMSALEKALEVKERRRIRREVNVDIEIPKKKIDVSALIKRVYEKIVSLFKKRDRVLFNDLVESDEKEDKVLTFIPLLHLAHQDEQKIDLVQERPFGTIEIYLHQSRLKNEITEEIGA